MVYVMYLCIWVSFLIFTTFIYMQTKDFRVFWFLAIPCLIHVETSTPNKKEKKEDE